MPENAVAGLDVAEFAVSSLALPRRAEQVLTVQRRLVPFDGAWPVSSRALVVAQRTAAAHIEHTLVELVTSTRTLVAVRAERAGRYGPCVPGLARGEAR